ncbi:MAG TPA: glycosyltransferase family 4 protein [Candidatus Acidoferrales bacterium]|nr:glycosyltransferase family 4 protein [Candidatus Acidoferrales bacterium]
MRITFLMPCYMWGPSGGYRVVYEYANRLVARGHRVFVLHPRNLKFAPSGPMTFRARLRNAKTRATELVATPSVDWHPIDHRVEMLFVPSSEERFVPDADVIFATAWHTVQSVLKVGPVKGEKCYLIQHYETFLGRRDLVDATWRVPIHKVVVSKWLAEIGRDLRASELTHIPNGIDHARYFLKQHIPGRPPRVAMMCSSIPFKGSRKGIEALQIAKRRYPDLKVVLFGKERRKQWIPGSFEYYRDPAQEFIVDEIYNKSSIFLSPSLSEGFALPPAEAAACGCAIVASDSGGIRDYVEDGLSGLLSQPGDATALAANLCRVLGNDSLRMQFARAANAAVKRLDWERSTDLIEKFLVETAVQARPKENVVRLGNHQDSATARLGMETT